MRWSATARGGGAMVSVTGVVRGERDTRYFCAPDSFLLVGKAKLVFLFVCASVCMVLGFGTLDLLSLLVRYGRDSVAPTHSLFLGPTRRRLPHPTSETARLKNSHAGRHHVGAQDKG